MNDLQTKAHAEITLSPNGALTPRNFEGLYRLATIMAASGMMPKGMETTEKVFVAVQMGMEVGLSPMAAVQNIASINGRPTIWGDAMLGLVRGSGLLEAIKEDRQGEGDQTEAICQVWRKGEDEPSVGRFSVADAKRAQLWGKQGPWTQYPKRMLQMRARGFALRDKFPDVLKGLYMREEMYGSTEVYMGEAEAVSEDVFATATSPDDLRRELRPEPAKPAAAPAPEPDWPKEIDGVLYGRSHRQDLEMIPWNERFHSSSRAVTQDGMFRLRKGYDQQAYLAWCESLVREQKEHEQPADPAPVDQSGAEIVGNGSESGQALRSGQEMYEWFLDEIDTASGIERINVLAGMVEGADMPDNLKDAVNNVLADVILDMQERGQ